MFVSSFGHPSRGSSWWVTNKLRWIWSLSTVSQHCIVLTKEGAAVTGQIKSLMTRPEGTQPSYCTLCLFMIRYSHVELLHYYLDVLCLSSLSASPITARLYPFLTCHPSFSAWLLRRWSRWSIMFDCGASDVGQLEIHRNSSPLTGLCQPCG